MRAAFVCVTMYFEVITLKNEVVYLVLQPNTEKEFWTRNSKLGIFDGAKELQCIPCILELQAPESLPKLAGVPVLVVGNARQWLETALHQLDALGARSIVVSASMQPTELRSHSGVVFELSRAITDARRQLALAGRTHTALLGANPHSVSDLCKCKAFDDPEQIIWAHGALEQCVLDFVESYKARGYDSVICANDTVAICLVRNMLGRGIPLPEELYIIGMGNFYISASLPLPLTSIDFDYYRMGRAAVKLYGFLKENDTCGTVVCNLPCRLTVRASAPLPEPAEQAHSSGDFPDLRMAYFSGRDARNIVKAESILQAGDEIDRKIVLGLMARRSAETIAQDLYLSTRAVRYRITNLLKKHGFADRAELLQAFESAIKETHDD